jgi:small redox-active disulfide protein 2
VPEHAADGRGLLLLRDANAEAGLDESPSRRQRFLQEAHTKEDDPMSISKVEVIGPGCPKCKALEGVATDAVRSLGLTCEVVKVADMAEIIRRGIMMTPALAINGKTVSTGRSLGKSDVEKLLKDAGA